MKLIDLIKLERLEDNLFRGQSRDIGSLNVFGGQVLGQGLNAAIRTVEKTELKFAHSLHAYFILPGDINYPIIYEVDRIRDGRSFATRQVKAIQKGVAILNMSVSFQKKEQGFEHQEEMPEVPNPENLISMADARKWIAASAPEKMKRFFTPKWPIEVRLVDPINPLKPENKAPIQHVWLKAIDKLPDDENIHKSVLTYASDFNLLYTSLLPHGKSYRMGEIQLASLDHSIWFHQSFRADEWLLYSMKSTRASNNRGLNFGNIYNKKGELVATVAQEGLIRKRRSND